jgi:hypothetical protein
LRSIRFNHSRADVGAARGGATTLTNIRSFALPGVVVKCLKQTKRVFEFVYQIAVLVKTRRTSQIFHMFFTALPRL